MAHDHRLVQTATLGGRRSQEPAFLPMTRSEALEFKRRHHASTFWCGDLLGGCGGRLGIKIYWDRVAHFAHHSSTNRCTRQHGGIDSADHLYAGKHVNRWLSGQGLPERRPHFDGDFATGGSCHRLTLPATDEHPAIFFEFTERMDAGLERLLDHMADRSPSWLVQRNPDLVHRLVRADGHALRFRMRTEGFERVVDIGVTSYGGHTQWHPISECSLTREGITSPCLDELRKKRNRREAGPRSASASTRDPARIPDQGIRPHPLVSGLRLCLDERDWSGVRHFAERLRLYLSTSSDPTITRHRSEVQQLLRESADALDRFQPRTAVTRIPARNTAAPSPRTSPKQGSSGRPGSEQRPPGIYAVPEQAGAKPARSEPKRPRKPRKNKKKTRRQVAEPRARAQRNEAPDQLNASVHARADELIKESGQRPEPGPVVDENALRKLQERFNTRLR
jgi:hypothetical protein